MKNFTFRLATSCKDKRMRFKAIEFFMKTANGSAHREGSRRNEIVSSIGIDTNIFFIGLIVDGSDTCGSLEGSINFVNRTTTSIERGIKYSPSCSWIIK